MAVNIDQPQSFFLFFFFYICLKNLRQQILELLGPISMNHGAHFMAAIAYVWNERKQVKTPVRNKVGV